MGAAFGLHGEVSCIPTRVGQNAIVAGVRLRLDSPVAGRPDVVVLSTRRHHGRLILALDGVTTPEAARAFTGRTLSVASADVALGTAEYFDADLIGLRIVDESGRELGTVSDIRHFPAQDCLVIEPGAGLVPLVRSFIRSIEIPRERIVVDLPAGLLDQSLAEEA